ncbi:DUF1002 domain-containing protein [Bacillus sp. 165]|uniref:DUF1002 domain-containing protein n=1 Tax=Bacillus sp. 165 TaxID=1529117 RepID=UPI001ADD2BC7|nr:DUF1002 domain-containing protein [Bacillus sp. 165]MBO9129828.1 DUF1002 domain-containing protein [Bacillus sp. 165]
MKTKWIAFLLVLVALFIPTSAFADAVEGETIVTLGENLTDQQKQQILDEMQAPKNAQMITVTNAEEHKYLGQYVPVAQIGTKALSSSMITYTKKGSGLVVQTRNITWVTEAMYTNALITAGLKDANIYITAPFKVSGTAALTGIMKAYEVSADKTIPEDVKQVANQEMVETAKLGDKIGSDKAVQLITAIKEEIAKNPPQTTEELRALIQKLADQLGISLTEDQLNNLVTLFEKMKDLNIDWNQVGDQLNKAKDQIAAFINSEEGQNFLDKLKSFFASLFDFVASLFK